MTSINESSGTRVARTTGGLSASVLLNPEPRTPNPFLRLCHWRLLRQCSRRGFTFTEVMFAVILLGIGFIMLAGMFPVAIQQTQTNVEQSTASTLVQMATRAMEESLTQADMPPTGNLDTVGPPPLPLMYPRFLRLSEWRNPSNGNIEKNEYLWQKTRGSFILPQDPRFAWTALYKRNPGDNFAQVIIFALQNRNHPNYIPADLDHWTIYNSSVDVGTFEPRYLDAILSDGGAPGEPDLIEFPQLPPTQDAVREAIAEGCFVVVADDRITADVAATPHFDPGYANGRIYRIGNRRADLDGKVNDPTALVWELMPGHDMQSPEENLHFRSSPHYGPQSSIPDYKDHAGGGTAPPAQVFIIGKGFTDITSNDTTLTGFAQDIAVYSTFIRLK
jgi:prepilin-type N-terminal cleavage/methylation domain-containing protein